MMVHTQTHLSNLFKLFFEAPSVVLLWRIGRFTRCRWVWACYERENESVCGNIRLSINHPIKCKLNSKMIFNLPSLFAAGVDEVKGKPFVESLLLCDVFWWICAGWKPKLLCNVLVNEGWRAEKSEFMKPTFMSRTCIFIFSRTSLCWKFWRFWTPMLRAERLLNMPNAWFDGNWDSLKDLTMPD